MKVMCIDAKPKPNQTPNPLVEGHVYTVAKDDWMANNGREGYLFVETYDWQMKVYKCFDKNRFVPLSDIDETELVKERENIYA